MKNIILTMAAIALLAGCGGGSGGGSPTTPVANQALDGIWSGAFTSTTIGGSVGAVLVISPTNEARYVTAQGVQTAGNLTSISGSSFTGSGVAFTPAGLSFPDGSTTGSLTFSGTGTSRQTLTGTYSGAGDQGTFNLSFDPIYDRASSLAAVSGIWTGVFISVGAGSVTLNIDTSGVITGSDTTGCVFNGLISIINPAKNLYTSSITQTVCAGSPLTVSGLLFLSDATPLTNNIINFDLSNATGSVAGNLGR